MSTRGAWAARIAPLIDAEGRLALRVTPGAAADRLRLGPGRVELAVTAPAEGGRANAAALKLLARALGVPRSALTLERGARGREKVVRVAS